jgi:hypothetical protein
MGISHPVPLPQAQASRHMSETSMYCVIHAGRIGLCVETPFIYAVFSLGLKYNLVDTFENSNFLVEESSL